MPVCWGVDEGGKGGYMQWRDGTSGNICFRRSALSWCRWTGRPKGGGLGIRTNRGALRPWKNLGSGIHRQRPRLAFMLLLPFWCQRPAGHRPPPSCPARAACGGVACVCVHGPGPVSPRLTPPSNHRATPPPLLAYVDTSRARKPAPPSLLAGQQQPWRPPEDQRGLVSFPFSSLSPWCWRWARWAPWPPRAPRSRPPSSHHQPRLLHSWAGQGPWAAARPCAPRGHVERYVPTALETHAPVSQPIPLHPTTHPLYD